MNTEKALPFVLVFAMSVVPGQVEASNTLSPNSQSTSSEKRQNMKISIRIGGKVLTATLANNETARDFVTLLPLNLSMKDLFGREKYATLPKPLLEKGPRTRSYQVGDIAYWSPAHDVAIYYHQSGESIPSPGIIQIAKIDGGTEAFNVSGSLKVTIELAK